jgi:hypothetical protein
VRYPAHPGDTLLELVEAAAFRPVWSADLIEEPWTPRKASAYARHRVPVVKTDSSDTW